MNNLLVKKSIVEGVKLGQIPRYLYKFRSLGYLEDILINSHLKFSNPFEFNDPFDNQLPIKVEFHKTADVVKYVDLYHPNAVDQFKGFLINRILKNPSYYEGVFRDSLKNAIDSKGICCFCSTPEDITLWSYYADGHKGVCLKFDVLKDTVFFSIPLTMIYQKEYALYNYCVNQDEILNTLLKTKSLCWQHEKEVRIVKKAPSFSKFNKESLSEIIFGCRCSQETIYKTMALVKNIGYSKIRFSKSTVKESEFGLNFIPVR